MTHRTTQLLAVAAGVALIVIYSTVMMSAEGAGGWAWVLLIAGLALLIGSDRLRRRDSSD